jgi:hypothetical protein
MKSDELESVDDYTDEDGESNSRRFPEFRIETDMCNPKFTLGMISRFRCKMSLFNYFIYKVHIIFSDNKLSFF